MMTTISTCPNYERQLSVDSGWDNPFQPDGDLSREADEIVSMIRGGNPITPTEDKSVGETTQKGKNGSPFENLGKKNVSQMQSEQNGGNPYQSNSKEKALEGAAETCSSHVSKQVVPGPTSASHVVIDEKKNRKSGCCTIL